MNSACIIRECPGSPQCSGRGPCEKGVCKCPSGWSGSSCDLSTSIIIE